MYIANTEVYHKHRNKTERWMLCARLSSCAWNGVVGLRPQAQQWLVHFALVQQRAIRRCRGYLFIALTALGCVQFFCLLKRPWSGRPFISPGVGGRGWDWVRISVPRQWPCRPPINNASVFHEGVGPSTPLPPHPTQCERPLVSVLIFQTHPGDTATPCGFCAHT